jgi:hypothetical protein
VLRWVKQKVLDWSVSAQEREMRDWIAKLAALDASEVGTIVAVAMHYRNVLANHPKIDLMYPFVAITLDPMIGIKLARDIQRLQSERLFSLASGVMVWLFTVRAAQAPELRMLGRQLWGELQRGFESVPEAAASVQELTGISLDTGGAGCFPDGLTPAPL